MTSATLLMLLAALMFGGAAVLLAYAGRGLMQQGGKAGAYAARAGQISMRRAEMRQLALQESPLFQALLPVIAMLGESVRQLGLEPLRQYVHGPYVRAGYPGGLEDEEVVAVGILLAGVFTLLGVFLMAALFGVAVVWLALVGVPLGFFALVAHLQSRGEEREVEVLRALPYVLDLLVLMLRSGTSLRIALARVVGDYDRHPLGVELGQVLAEMDVGAARGEAFKKMAERLKIPDITSLVDAIVQSEELGWPLADTLERLADRINAERVLQAQAKAGAAGVYVMVPSTLVLLSAILLLFAPFIVLYLVTGSIVGS